MGLEFVHIWRDVSAAHLSRQHSLGHGKEGGSKSSNTSQFKCMASHHTLPGTWDFDSDACDVKSRLDMLEQLHNS